MIAVSALLGAQAMANIDTAIVNIAAPSIRAGFGTSDQTTSLVVAGYLVAYATLLIIGARLGGRYGFRPVFLIGVAAFTIASLACGLSPSVVILIAARIGQGAAAALMVPQVLTGIQLGFTGRQRSRVLGAYAAALSGGAVVGQVLGGLLISADLFGLGWRTVFLINIPIGALVIMIGWRFLPDAGLPRTVARIDLLGSLGLGTAVLLVIAPLALGPQHGWPWWTWLSLTASVPVFGWFVRRQRSTAARGGRPLIDRELLRPAAIRGRLLAYGLTTATYLALLFVLALFLQRGLGYGPAMSGLALVTWVSAFGIAGLSLNRLPDRWEARAPVIGCLLLAAGYLGASIDVALGAGIGPRLLILLAIGGFGLGCSARSLINAITAAVTPAQAAELSGVISTNAQLSGAVGVAAAGAIYSALSARLAASGSFAVVLLIFAAMSTIAAVVANAARRGQALGNRS
ncbi:MAG TPA: MFS transporter [Microlunatus sp.]